MANLKAVQKEVYIHVILRKIKLAKEIFITELECGKDVFIPHELSQDKLPSSFRYYDPIVQIINSDCSVEARQNFILKNKMEQDQKNKGIVSSLFGDHMSDLF